MFFFFFLGISEWRQDVSQEQTHTSLQTATPYGRKEECASCFCILHSSFTVPGTIRRSTPFCLPLPQTSLRVLRAPVSAVGVPRRRSLCSIQRENNHPVTLCRSSSVPTSEPQFGNGNKTLITRRTEN